MDQRVKKLWVGALGSGDYPQIEGYLRTENGFCCLGVLTDLYIKEKGLAWVTDPEIEHVKRFPFGIDPYFLPREVQEWAGLPNEQPECKGKPLSEWNDEDGLSFKEIADLIEQYL